MKRLLPLLLLAGCGHVQEPPIVTQSVVTAVPVSCVPADLQGPPAYVDSDAALRRAPDAAARFRLLGAGRVQRNARLAVVEPVLKSCRDK